MLFNSYAFLLAFLPITLFIFFFLGKKSHLLAGSWLTIASLFFYSCWNLNFLFLLLASVTTNYVFGYGIDCTRQRSTAQAKSLLIFSIIINITALAYFKYANFFIENINQMSGMQLLAVNVILPLGISFFTFTQIAFLVDVYRGIAREYNFIHYVLFVSYFPHLIAGPVLHHKQMMPQFGNPDTYQINTKNINLGLSIFIVGLAKKILLADQFALYANPVFDAAATGGEPQLLEAWAGALAYTLQLYFDFSGYSDMAIGLSLMFNVKLPLNFNSPYKAPNIIEFWRRWHMTLSTFLRDYLYIPLGGSRKGVPQRYLNLMITMLLGGFWHGAGWTFIIWGGLHGFFLVLNHGWNQMTGICNKPSAWRNMTGILLTFSVVVISWVPFRATNLETTLRIWAGMFGHNGISLPNSLAKPLVNLQETTFIFNGIFPLTRLEAVDIIFWIMLGLAIVWLSPNTQEFFNINNNPIKKQPNTTKKNFLDHIPIFLEKNIQWKPNNAWIIVLAAIAGLSLANIGRSSEFLYFQF